MSNLSLPKMTFKNLSKIAGDKIRKDIKVAYETYIYQYEDGSIAVMHHNSVIAEFSQGGSKLYITNAGWGSSTTRNRLHTILKDNGIEWGLTQKNFVQVLIRYGAETESYKGFKEALFWDGVLWSVNGIDV